jgi:hypothetical protein
MEFCIHQNSRSKSAKRIYDLITQILLIDLFGNFSFRTNSVKNRNFVTARREIAGLVRQLTGLSNKSNHDKRNLGTIEKVSAHCAGSQGIGVPFQIQVRAVSPRKTAINKKGHPPQARGTAPISYLPLRNHDMVNVARFFRMARFVLPAGVATEVFPLRIGRQRQDIGRTGHQSGFFKIVHSQKYIKKRQKKNEKGHLLYW